MKFQLSERCVCVCMQNITEMHTKFRPLFFSILPLQCHLCDAIVCDVGWKVFEITSAIRDSRSVCFIPLARSLSRVLSFVHVHISWKKCAAVSPFMINCCKSLELKIALIAFVESDFYGINCV
jgi:hypothetical protein